MIVIVCFAPLSHADAVRAALAGGGAGRIGEYSACSFTARGEGRFLPSERADPFSGTRGELSVVEEVRIEAVCAPDRLVEAVRAMLAAHPYEEPAWHAYETVDLPPGAVR